MLDSKIVMYAALAVLIWFVVFKKTETYDEDYAHEDYAHEDYDEDSEEDYEDSDDE